MLVDGAVERVEEACRAIGAACTRAGVAQWDVLGSQTYGTEVDIEAGRISLVGGGGEGGFGLRLVQDGRFAFARVVDASGAERAVQEAMSILRRSPSVDGFELPAATQVSSTPSSFDRRVDDLTAEDLMQRADAVLAHVASEHPDAVVTGGGISASASATAFLSSEGIERSAASTSMGLGVQVTIDHDDQLTSGWEGTSDDGLLPHVPDCVDLALRWATRTRNPIEVTNTRSGRQDVILSDGAFGSLFGMIVPRAINGPRLARNESLWSGRLGERVMADHLSIVDDGRLAGGATTASIDGDGVPTSTRTIVDGGRFVAANWSVRGAAKAVADGQIEHAESTGSASRSVGSPPSTSTRDLVLTSTAARPSPEALVQQVEDGWLVHDVMGAHTANPTTGDFSVTTSSVLRIVDGEIVGAVRQAGLTGNLAEALGGDVVLAAAPGRDGRPGGSLHLADVLFRGSLGVNPA
jgi:PmbA protein